MSVPMLVAWVSRAPVKQVPWLHIYQVLPLRSYGSTNSERFLNALVDLMLLFRVEHHLRQRHAGVSAQHMLGQLGPPAFLLLLWVEAKQRVSEGRGLVRVLGNDTNLGRQVRWIKEEVFR